MSPGKMVRRHWGWKDWKIVEERKGCFAFYALKVVLDQDQPEYASKVDHDQNQP